MVVKSIIITTFIIIIIIIIVIIIIIFIIINFIIISFIIIITIIIIVIIINWNEIVFNSNIVFNLMIFFESKLRLFNRKNEMSNYIFSPPPHCLFRFDAPENHN